MLKLASLAALALMGSSASAQPPATAGQPVAGVVAIPVPPGAPRSLIEAEMQKAVPAYKRVPGLLRKYFTVGNGAFGGIYLFQTRAAADAWFSDAWRKRIQDSYNAQASVTVYDAPIVLDNDRQP